MVKWLVVVNRTLAGVCIIFGFYLILMDEFFAGLAFLAMALFQFLLARRGTCVLATMEKRTK